MPLLALKETGKISYFEAGEGPCIVYLHGFLESASMWKHLMSEKGFYNVAVDLPGFGMSDCTRDSNSMAFMASCVCEVLKHLMISEFVVVGHSMGGYVALELARQYPMAVKGMVLFHSHAFGDDETTKLNRERTIQIVEQNHHHFIAQFIPELFAPDNRESYSSEINNLKNEAVKISPKGIVAAIRGMKERNDNTIVLKNSGFPVLFIAGKQDSRIPVENVMKMAVLPGHAEALILDNTGHMGFIEAREVTSSVISDFADRCFSRR